MTETKQSGGKEFIAVLIMIALAAVLAWILQAVFSQYGALGQILAIAVFAALGYYVEMHFCAVYTYTIEGDKLVVTRALGKRRVKEYVFTKQELKSMTKTAPSGRVKHYGTFTLTRANRVYIRDNSGKTAAIDPSPEFFKKLKRAAGNVR